MREAHLALTGMSPKTRRDVCLLTALGLTAFALGFFAATAHAQGSEQPAAATIDTTSEAGEADAVAPKRQLVSWNQYDGPISSLRFGYGFVWDLASVVQDDGGKQQFSVPTDNGLRDFRLLFKGRIKTQREFSWTLGYMYDGVEEAWRFRQTGFQIGIPELSGRVFLGRTKEGFSQAKVMVGYYIVGMERSQALDAFIPILGDGIKYMGYYPKKRVFLNLGYFFDGLTTQAEKEKFAIYDHQTVARLGWQPILSDADKKVFHVAVMGRLATPDEGKIKFKSKPGSWLAPNFLDTGTLTGEHANTFGLEANYRSGSWLFASEYDWQTLEVAGGGKPMFHGGEVTVNWLLTGESRPYNAAGGFYQQVTPAKTVFEGGRGAIEAGLGYTFNDFKEGSFGGLPPIDGGKFWRVTPMLKWYLSEYYALVGSYGYSELDRFGVKGHTQFFQARFVTIL